MDKGGSELGGEAAPVILGDGRPCRTLKSHTKRASFQSVRGVILSTCVMDLDVWCQPQLCHCNWAQSRC